jgi:hypothetical protein
MASDPRLSDRLPWCRGGARGIRHPGVDDSVIRILHGHGAERCGQGLADGDVSTAELHRAGAVLAQLGERFGVSPNTVRRALVSAGVAMRPRVSTTHSFQILGLPAVMPG